MNNFLRIFYKIISIGSDCNLMNLWHLSKILSLLYIFLLRFFDINNWNHLFLLKVVAKISLEYGEFCIRNLTFLNWIIILNKKRILSDLFVDILGRWVNFCYFRNLWLLVCLGLFIRLLKYWSFLPNQGKSWNLFWLLLLLNNHILPRIRLIGNGLKKWRLISSFLLFMVKCCIALKLWLDLISFNWFTKLMLISWNII